jgi:hypothetical protein
LIVFFRNSKKFIQHMDEIYSSHFYGCWKDQEIESRLLEFSLCFM